MNVYTLFVWLICSEWMKITCEIEFYKQSIFIFIWDWCVLFGLWLLCLWESNGGFDISITKYK